MLCLCPLTVMGTHDITLNLTYSSEHSTDATSFEVIKRVIILLKFYWHFISSSLWTHNKYISKCLLFISCVHFIPGTILSTSAIAVLSGNSGIRYKDK